MKWSQVNNSCRTNVTAPDQDCPSRLDIPHFSHKTLTTVWEPCFDIVFKVLETQFHNLKYFFLNKKCVKHAFTSASQMTAVQTKIVLISMCHNTCEQQLSWHSLISTASNKLLSRRRGRWLKRLSVMHHVPSSPSYQCGKKILLTLPLLA